VTGSLASTAARITSRGWYLALRTVGELASVPVALASGVLTTPFNYAYAQARGLVTQPVDHVMDSFAQVPGLEILVEGFGRASDREIPWGRRGKGFFNLGALNESVGRLHARAMFDDIPSEVYSLADLENAARNGGCGLPRCKGLILLDATDFIEVGSFGLSLNRPGVDFTLGWLDPLGSHTDYKNDTVVRIMAAFSEGVAGHR
jgi:hypothetical protein